jgi:hypothetical protein
VNDVKMFDPNKIDSLSNSWSHNRASQNLFLHAEMQIALFYALNPHLFPIQGFIGPRRPCVLATSYTDKSTRYLRIPGEQDRRCWVTSSVLGPRYSYHNCKYDALFPNSSAAGDVLDPISFAKVCHNSKLYART